jgi:pimeloyl-ACP methyl ester carboxylesterase
MYPNWQQGVARIGELSMHYTRTGGDKPVIVLAHGFTDNGLCWLPLAQDLGRDYDVILPDARGHGLSWRVKPGESINRAADLAGFIQALSLDRPVVGGHSMGGVTAAMLGAHHPDLACALILEDPAWFEQPPQPPRRFDEDNPWRKQLVQMSTLTIEEIMAICRKNSPTWPEAELRPWAESKQQFDLNVFTVQDQWADWKEVARRISAPTLLITAEPEKGGLITPQIARTAQELNPLIQVSKIPAAGHNIRRENFPAFLDAVRKFLKSL